MLIPLSWNRLSKEDVRSVIDDVLNKDAISVDAEIEEFQKRLIQLKKLRRIYKPIRKQFKHNLGHSGGSQRHINI